jgi:hypothetical protein
MSGYPGDRWSVETAAEIGPLLQKPFDAHDIAHATRVAIDKRRCTASGS